MMMLNQETGHATVPPEIARTRRIGRNTNALLCKAADDARMMFHGLRWRSLASETPSPLLCWLARSQSSDGYS